MKAFDIRPTQNPSYRPEENSIIQKIRGMEQDVGKPFDFSKGYEKDFNLYRHSDEQFLGIKSGKLPSDTGFFKGFIEGGRKSYYEGWAGAGTKMFLRGVNWFQTTLDINKKISEGHFPSEVIDQAHVMTPHGPWLDTDFLVEWNQKYGDGTLKTLEEANAELDESYQEAYQEANVRHYRAMRDAPFRAHLGGFTAAFGMEMANPIYAVPNMMGFGTLANASRTLRVSAIATGDLAASATYNFGMMNYRRSIGMDYNVDDAILFTALDLGGSLTVTGGVELFIKQARKKAAARIRAARKANEGRKVKAVDDSIEHMKSHVEELDQRMKDLGEDADYYTTERELYDQEQAINNNSIDPEIAASVRRSIDEIEEPTPGIDLPDMETAQAIGDEMAMRRVTQSKTNKALEAESGVSRADFRSLDEWTAAVKRGLKRPMAEVEADVARQQIQELQKVKELLAKEAHELSPQELDYVHQLREKELNDVRVDTSSTLDPSSSGKAGKEIKDAKTDIDALDRWMALCS